MVNPITRRIKKIHTYIEKKKKVVWSNNAFDLIDVRMKNYYNDLEKRAQAKYISDCADKYKPPAESHLH